MGRGKRVGTSASTSGGGGGEEGSGQSGIDIERPFNVAIFPIQLIHQAASDPLPPKIEPFPEADFEDCSSFVDLWRLRHGPLHNGKASSSNGHISIQSNDDEDITFVSISNGKRKAASPADDRSRKRQRDDLITLTSTVCRFRVLLQLEEERKYLEDLQRPGGGTLHSQISELRIVSRSALAEEDSWMKTALQVYDAEGNLLATLPLIDTDSMPFDRSPHRLTNGKWLESAVVLCSGRTGKEGAGPVKVECSLNLGDPTSLPQADSFTLELHVSIHASLDSFDPAASSSPPWLADHLHRVMRFCFPDDAAEQQMRSRGELSASAIYPLLPSSRLPPLDRIQPVHLDSTLYPFQMRSVNFLLGREGKRVKSKTEDGDIMLENVDGVMAYDGVRQLGLWWQEVRSDDGILYYNALYGKLTRSIEETQLYNISGSILADEMGLGKTVSTIALVMLNSDEKRSQMPSYYDYEQEIDIHPTKTTLVVAPETLRQQWIDEIALHAPHLRVFSYLGYQDAAKNIPSGTDWRDHLKQFDVMVASFDTLRKEINVAKKAPNRSRRFERKYERPRSLLVQLAFHRVVMDEVQMVGHSYAAETVSMIHRRYSLAVSGTPIKAITDLKSLFFFLRVLTPAVSRHWDRLLSPALLPSLARCFGTLATRHTKLQVRSEMTLPSQTRILVPINFTAIEAAFYKDIYSRALDALDIDLNDYATNRDLFDAILKKFDEDVGQLRSTLIALRQACTHPQIARSHVRGGNYLAGTALATSNTIRSMDEVLTIMIEGSKAEMAFIWQQMARKNINRAVLLLQDKTNDGRLVIAREMLTSMLDFVQAKISVVEEDAKRARFIGPLYKFSKDEVAANERSFSELGSEATDELEQPSMLSTANQVERDKEHETAERRLHRSRHLKVLSARWRYFTEQLHRAHHFLGNVYFQLGEAKKVEEAKEAIEEPADGEIVVKGEGVSSREVIALKKQEDDAYDRAEKVRVRLLQLSRKVVEHALVSLNKSPVNFTLQGLAVDVDLGSGGIKTDLIFEDLHATSDVLDRQAEMLFKWRGEILERLRKPVSRDVSEEDELDDQYQENLDAQAEAEALTEMYRMVLNQRELLLSGVRIAGAVDKPALYAELGRHFKTKTKMSLMQSIDPDNAALRRQLDDSLSEEEEEVMKLQLNHFEKLDMEQKRVFEDAEEESGGLNDQQSETVVVQERDGRSQRKAHDSVEGVAKYGSMALDLLLKTLREKMSSLDGSQEIAIARMAMDKMRPIISSQKTMCDKLKREHLLFMALFNARSAYFKHIQELSDHVSDIATTNISKEMGTLQEDEVALKNRERAVAGRLRYLNAIEQEEGHVEGSSSDSQTRTCIICTEPLIKAVIFNTCGHSTCESCFKKWTLKHGQCPMCKTRVSSRDAYHVTYVANDNGKKRQVQVPQEDRRQRQQARYNIMSEDLARNVATMSIRSALGSKLDLLTRHLMYIEHTKPGTKSLIFTAFSRGMTLVGDALRSNHIRYVTLDKGGVKASRVTDDFKNDPNINVLLLHSEAQSSGLNLNMCENVFLLEPLVNHSIELQAIGRVHRIGQVRETSVFIYQVNDTVEERIVELAADRGQSLVTRENCVSQHVKDSAEMTAKTQEGLGKPKGKKDGEFVASMEEIFRCLFEDEEQAAHSTITPSLSPVKCKEEAERERMRKERLMAAERRQAMSSIAREREQ